MKCVDLFSGCGGLSLGFNNAGINVVAAIDNWDKSVDIYNKNFSHKCYLHDLTDEDGALNIINKYKPDMIAGGPPCQDFSSAGKRDETLGRANLTYHFANMLVIDPKEYQIEPSVAREIQATFDPMRARTLMATWPTHFCSGSGIMIGQ